MSPTSGSDAKNKCTDGNGNIKDRSRDNRFVAQPKAIQRQTIVADIPKGSNHDKSGNHLSRALECHSKKNCNSYTSQVDQHNVTDHGQGTGEFNMGGTDRMEDKSWNKNIVCGPGQGTGFQLQATTHQSA